MRLLLDTHVWLWSILEPTRLGPRARELVEDADNHLVLSAASSWEISIKYNLERLPLPEPPGTFILSRLARDGVEALPIQHNHVCAVAELPRHHRDPFDRLLIAVSQQEDLPLLTADRQFLPYDVAVIQADE
ncbi:MAG TPA: type II toxin-antitoxin system VapC family toxin [Candidatus Latescibacteria bacterium]|nr:PIN domain nuclease [Gemmatimonadaceae bacterium]MDP6017117.1 type II toxin-antitoxin system VapC family toxin [Candidatus Latescibacterota bacterium]HJP32380.1 type II toxin-antitoxin system VapC family toxin [Candidatus Latescibacterota bacterium]